MACGALAGLLVPKPVQSGGGVARGAALPCGVSRAWAGACG